MDLGLKSCLVKYHASALACYNAMDKKLQLHDTLFKFIMGALTPQSTRFAVKASDGCLTIDATIVAVVPDASSSTT